MNWEETIIESAATDTGMRRTNNQDCHAIVRASRSEQWRKRGHVFMVADGMGAHAVGELASKLACDNIPHNYNKSKHDSPVEAIIKSYHEVGGIIHSKATANSDFQGMGTTCSTLILLPSGVLIAHVGDSRIYRVRQGRIDQLTFDHSLVWELVRHKHLTLEQAQKAVPRNVITRSLGPDPIVEVDIEGPYPVEEGDVFVLCSDGLSGPVGDAEIGSFAENLHPEDAARFLTHLANLRGGIDNITTLVVRIGPWADRGGESKGAAGPAGKASTSGRAGGWLSSLLHGKRAANIEPVEERIYGSAECPINASLLDRLGKDLASVQAMAIEQVWNVDWGVFSNLKREAEEARAGNELSGCLRCIGEMIAILGQAGRAYRKARAANEAQQE